MYRDWTGWSLPSFCCIWIILCCAARTNGSWLQVVLGGRPNSMECSATRAACNRGLCVFLEKTKNIFFIQIYGPDLEPR